jgi:hypothetical protein
MYFSAIELAFISRPDVWPDSIVVSDEIHNTIMTELANGRVLSADGNGYPVTVEHPPEPELPIEQLVSNTIYKLNGDYEAAVTKLRGNYPAGEITTWPVQIAEAKLYNTWRLAGSTPPSPDTPFLIDLSSARTAEGVGDGLIDLIDRVLANDAIYSPAISHLTAVRHAAERDLLMAKAIGTVDDVKAVTWNFSMELPDEPTATQPEEV